MTEQWAHTLLAKHLGPEYEEEKKKTRTIPFTPAPVHGAESERIITKSIEPELNYKCEQTIISTE